MYCLTRVTSVLATRKFLIALLVILLWTWGSKQAVAQNARDVINLCERIAFIKLHSLICI
jgi:hypothetical protein